MPPRTAPGNKRGAGRPQPRSAIPQPRSLIPPPRSAIPAEDPAGSATPRSGVPAGPATPRSGGAAGPARAPTANAPGVLPQHIETIGVRRTAVGRSGTPFSVFTNHYPVKIPEEIIHHYDVIHPDEKKLPARVNMLLIDRLQTVIAPQVFTPRAAYDGRKNMFAICEYPFPGGSREFDVTLADESNASSAAGNTPGRGPKVYKISLRHVASINPEVLSRFLDGKQSHDNTVLTAITALNVVIRMQPTLSYPFNVRSFFTSAESIRIGKGFELWRGYFQSIRPSPGRMLINIDISTGMMYRSGSLYDLCLEFFSPVGQRSRPPSTLLQPGPGNAFLTESRRMSLQRFITGVRVFTYSGSGAKSRTARVVRKLTTARASGMSFKKRDGSVLTVEQYFAREYNYKLKHPEAVCAEIGSGAIIPLELCEVPPGQIIRKQVPPELTSEVIKFASKMPQDRLRSIHQGLGVLAYGQSEYVRQFGLQVEQNEPLLINARVLEPPTLKFGAGTTVIPRNGTWNMMSQRVYQPAKIDTFIVVSFMQKREFSEEQQKNTVAKLVEACENLGIIVADRRPHIVVECNAQSSIPETLVKAGAKSQQDKGRWPNLIVVILPEGAANVYNDVKHFGDITTGIATQCLQGSKCRSANLQYFANVGLKINVKLGGINTIPDTRSFKALTDPATPTIVMGADVMHPAPGADGQPSFTALVANIDDFTAKYAAECRVQTSRQEMIDDLEEMSEALLKLWIANHRAQKPPIVPLRRIIFYRDGVSEGQFKQVLDLELPMLKRACQKLKVNPKITVIVVGKRHHVRFFPKEGTSGGNNRGGNTRGRGGFNNNRNRTDADQSGNCPAGTVVDTDVVSPVEFDFYLQSHAGLLGTSRPAHYNVLYDENGFSPDSLQLLSFELCHMFARSTRSVSIPAPVYYADIVCSRGKLHFADGVDSTEVETLDSNEADEMLAKYKRDFKPLNPSHRQRMYFS